MFERPMVLEFFLEFPVVTRGIIVDAILHNKGFYLQPAEMGLHIIQGIEKGIILVEVADTGFLSVWNGLYERKMVEKFRERELSKSEAQKAGKKHLKLVRELWIKRF